MSTTPEDELELRPGEQETVASFERQRRRLVRAAVYAGLAGFALFVLGLYFAHTSRIGSPSELGDYVAGTAGAAWALAGVLLVYLAFVGQRVQLVYQQAELRAARAEFRQQTSALKGQQREMNRQVMESQRQTFDAGFFQMMGLYTSVLGQIGVLSLSRSSGSDVYGRDALFELKALLPTYIGRHFTSLAEQGLASEGVRAPTSSDYPSPAGFRAAQIAHGHQVEQRSARIQESISSVSKAEAYLKSFETLYASHQHEVGHYFRTLYHVVKYVDTAADQLVQDKHRYVSIVRSQLSSPELVLLAYNGLTHGREKFKPLMERYGLLKQMPSDDLVDSLKVDYEPGAFGNEVARTGVDG